MADRLVDFLFQNDNDYISQNHLQILFFFIFFTFSFYFVLFVQSVVLYFTNVEFLSKEAERRKIAMRISSSIHATTVSFLSIWHLMYNNELHQNKFIYVSEEISFTLNIVMGYMAFDTMNMLMYEDLLEPVSIFHHFVSVAAFYACSHLGVFSFIAIARLTSESSTPLINNRFLLLSFRQEESIFYMVNGILVVLVFGLCRVLPIVPIWYIFYEGIGTDAWNKIDLFYKVLCVITSLPLDVLNVYWFQMIFKKAVKVLQGKEDKED